MSRGKLENYLRQYNVDHTFGGLMAPLGVSGEPMTASNLEKLGRGHVRPKQFKPSLFDACTCYTIQDHSKGEYIFSGNPMDSSGNGFVLGNRAAKVDYSRLRWQLEQDGDFWRIKHCSTGE